MGKKIKYKSGTILTDGKNLIYLGKSNPPNWTPSNNHGHKDTDYVFCNTYPKRLRINGILVVNDKYIGYIPGLWFQPLYHLNHFRPIHRDLINTEIYKQLIQ